MIFKPIIFPNALLRHVAHSVAILARAAGSSQSFHRTVHRSMLALLSCLCVMAFDCQMFAPRPPTSEPPPWCLGLTCCPKQQARKRTNDALEEATTDVVVNEPSTSAGSSTSQGGISTSQGGSSTSQGGSSTSQGAPPIDADVVDGEPGWARQLAAKAVDWAELQVRKKRTAERVMGHALTTARQAQARIQKMKEESDILEQSYKDQLKEQAEKSEQNLQQLRQESEKSEKNFHDKLKEQSEKAEQDLQRQSHLQKLELEKSEKKVELALVKERRAQMQATQLAEQAKVHKLQIERAARLTQNRLRFVGFEMKAADARRRVEEAAVARYAADMQGLLE